MKPICVTCTFLFLALLLPPGLTVHAGSPFESGIANPAHHQWGDSFLSHPPVLANVQWHEFVAGSPLTVPVQIDHRKVYWSEESGTVSSAYRGGTGYFVNPIEAHNFIAPGSGVMACGDVPFDGLPPWEQHNSISFEATYHTASVDSGLSDAMDAYYYTPVRGYVAPGGRVELQYDHQWTRNGAVVLRYFGTWTRDVPGYFAEPLGEGMLIDNALTPNVDIQLSTRVTYRAVAGDVDGSASYIYSYEPLSGDSGSFDTTFTETCNPIPGSMALSNLPENNTIEFGLVRAGTLKRMPAFTVSNTSVSDFDLSYSLPSRSFADFEQPTNLGHFWPVPQGTTLPATAFLLSGEHEDYDYIVDSADRGNYVHIVSVPNGGTMTSLLLTAQAVGPVATLDAPLLHDAEFDYDYYALDFGNVEPGTQVTRTVTIRNTSDDPNGGDSALTDLGLFSFEVFTENSASDLFLVDGETAGEFAPGTILSQGEARSFSITFQAPLETGVFTGEWRVVTDEGWDVGTAWGSIGLAISATVGDVVPPAVGDLDGDGLVGRLDAILLGEHFGTSGDVSSVTVHGPGNWPCVDLPVWATLGA